MSTKASEVVPFSRGRSEARKCKRVIESSKAAFLAMVREVGSRYSALTSNQDKRDFRDELDIGKNTASEYAQIAKKADAKLTLIKAAGGQEPVIIESFRTWRELVRTPDTMLRKAARAGLFDHEVTSESLTRFKTKGLVRKPTPETKTVVARAKAKLDEAERAINVAVGKVSALRNFMDEHDITQMKGVEIQILQHTFKLLCAEIAATDPKMLEKALKPLRGED